MRGQFTASPNDIWQPLWELYWWSFLSKQSSTGNMQGMNFSSNTFSFQEWRQFWPANQLLCLWVKSPEVTLSFCLLQLPSTWLPISTKANNSPFKAWRGAKKKSVLYNLVLFFNYYYYLGKNKKSPHHKGMIELPKVTTVWTINYFRQSLQQAVTAPGWVPWLELSPLPATDFLSEHQIRFLKASWATLLHINTQ